jgi:shikimate kinase
MGSGKSTVGKQLAGHLGFSCIDLDVVFEQTYRLAIMDFFKKYDEDAFRQLERKLLFDTFSLENHVISTGGGTACFSDNMELMNGQGLTVYIKMHPKSLFVRLKNSKRLRPRTSGLQDDDLQQTIENDLIVRRKYYEMAQFQVKGEDIQVQKVAELLKPALLSFPNPYKF